MRVVANYPMLGMCTVCSICDAVRWVQDTRVSPPRFLYVTIQQLGMSNPSSRLKREFSGVLRMKIASFMTNCMVRDLPLVFITINVIINRAVFFVIFSHSFTVPDAQFIGHTVRKS